MIENSDAYIQDERKILKDTRDDWSGEYIYSSKKESQINQPTAGGKKQKMVSSRNYRVILYDCGCQHQRTPGLAVFPACGVVVVWRKDSSCKARGGVGIVVLYI